MAKYNEILEYMYDESVPNEIIEYSDVKEYFKDNYDGTTVTRKQYEKACRELEEIFNVIVYYVYDGKGYIELSDNHTLWNFDFELDKSESEIFEITYCNEVNKAAEIFEQETGIELFYLGRSGRHVCIIDNFENARLYASIREIQKRLESEVIRNITNMFTNVCSVANS